MLVGIGRDFGISDDRTMTSFLKSPLIPYVKFSPLHDKQSALCVLAFCTMGDLPEVPAKAEVLHACGVAMCVPPYSSAVTLACVHTTY